VAESDIIMRTRMENSMLTLRSKMKNGQPVFGAWILTNSADVVEIMALNGMDFVVIDHEHGQGTLPDLINQLRALKGTNCTGIVRVPNNDPIYIKRVLDAGIDGIMVPQISSLKEAQAVLSACHYPPKGGRGAFGGMRAMGYGTNPNYYSQIADDLIIAVQIENPDAIDNIPSIGMLEGIDIIFIGPRDLSASLGKLNQFSDPIVREHIERAEKAILASNCYLGSTAMNGKVASDMVERGYRLLIPGSDAMLLGAGVKNVLAEAKNPRLVERPAALAQ